MRHLFWEQTLHSKKEAIGKFRSRIDTLLRTDDFEKRLMDWSGAQPRRLINPLLSFLYSPDERLKWNAVSAVGLVTAQMAEQDMESARVIMRRLIWSLNDESGGIGWGSPEAMGEIMARHGGLAAEYSCILISYIRPDCNLLENELLEAGVLWGIGRLAQARPEFMQEEAVHVAPYLASVNTTLRGLAAWVLGFLDAACCREELARLADDREEIRIFENGRLLSHRLCDLAQSALKKPAGRS